MTSDASSSDGSTGSAPGPDLAALRGEIDRIDAQMHALLIERSEIIDTLIAVKKSRDTGSAFRPGREASMMRAIAQRHRGLLPLDTVEGIWRVIIGTFTYVQAPYRVHADISGGEGAMRDSARFHFGFTVPYVPQPDASHVIAAVAGAAGDLGIFRLDQGVTAGPWWQALTEPQAPKVIARLPFIERPGHPAGTPVFVISRPLADAAVREVVLFSARVERFTPAAPVLLAAQGGEIVASVGEDRGLALLVAMPGPDPRAALAQVLTTAGMGAIELDEIGGHSARFSAGTAA
jgi:chorismate mutase